jgi:hypothetical protein
MPYYVCTLALQHKYALLRLFTSIATEIWPSTSVHQQRNRNMPYYVCTPTAQQKYALLRLNTNSVTEMQATISVT